MRPDGCGGSKFFYLCKKGCTAGTVPLLVPAVLFGDRMSAAVMRLTPVQTDRDFYGCAGASL